MSETHGPFDTNDKGGPTGEPVFDPTTGGLNVNIVGGASSSSSSAATETVTAGSASATPVPVQLQSGSGVNSATDPLFVAASTANYTLGSGTQTPTVTAGAYTVGQAVGGLLTFSGLLRSTATTGTLQKALLTFNDTQTPVVDLILFNAAPTATTITDHSTFSLAAADVTKVVGVIHITDSSAAGTPTLAQALQLQLPFIVGTAGASLYGVLVTRAAITLGSTSDVSVALVGYSD